MLLILFLSAGAVLSAQYHKPVLDLNFTGVPGKCISLTGHTIGLSDRDDIAFLKKGGLRIDEDAAYFTSHFRSDLFDGRTLSGSFRVLFDEDGLEDDRRKLSFGAIELTLDKDLIPTLTFQAKKGDLLGPDLSIRGRSPVKPDTYHDFTFRYSVPEQWAEFSMDGDLQGAVGGYLPLLEMRPIICGRGFIGTVAHLRLYDGSLDPDELRIMPSDPAEITVYRQDLSDALALRVNPYLSFLCKTILTGDPAAASLTVREWENMKRRASELNSLARELSHGKALIRDRILTVFITEPESLETFSPYTMPPVKDLLKQPLRLVAAGNGTDHLPFLIYSFARIPDLKVVPQDLKSPEGKVISADNVRIAVLTRRFVSSPFQRNYAVPFRFTTDENVIRIDEAKRLNLFRISYPDGDIWMEYEDEIPARFLKEVPPTLNRTGFTAPCTAKAFLLEVKADAPAGIYSGAVKLVADGRDAGEIPVQIRVLPFRIKPRSAGAELRDDAGYPVRDVKGYAEVLQTLCTSLARQPQKAKMAHLYEVGLCAQI